MAIEGWVLTKWLNRAWFTEHSLEPKGRRLYLRRCRHGRIRFWVQYLRHVKNGEGLKSSFPDDHKYPLIKGRGWESVASRKQLRKITAGQFGKKRRSGE